MRRISRCQGLSDGRMLLQEIEEVLLGQFHFAAEVLFGVYDRRRAGRLDAGRQRAPQLVIGFLFVFDAPPPLFQHAFLRRPRRPAIAEHALVHQRMRGIEDGLDLVAAVALLAGGDVALGEGEIVENALGIGPLLEQIIVLEEVVVAEGGMRHDERLHRHGVLFEQVGNAGARIDHDLVGQRRIAVAVHGLFAREQLAERPMVVHQRHAERGIGVQHLLGRDHLDLVGIDVELEIVQRDLLDRLVGAVERGEIPFRFGEEIAAHAASVFLNSSRNTGKMSAGLAMRLVAKLGHSSATVR